jgi:type IV secretory pathway TrbF-like protein
MKPEESIATRQKTAQDLWSDALTKLTNALTSWRVMALGLMGINGMLVLALIWQFQTVRIVPFIDVVDPQNRLLWSGPAGSYTPDDLWVGNALQEWLTDIRSRPGQLQKPGNLAVLNARWQKAYALTDRDAAKQLAHYIEEENPLRVKEPIEVSLTVEAISRYPHRAEDGPTIRVFHLEWTEDWTLRGQTKRLRFTGDFWAELRPDARKGQTEAMTQKGVDRGKPGLYIIKFRWDQKLTGAAS